MGIVPNADILHLRNTFKFFRMVITIALDVILQFQKKNQREHSLYFDLS